MVTHGVHAEHLEQRCSHKRDKKHKREGVRKALASMWEQRTRAFHVPPVHLVANNLFGAPF